MPLKKEANLRGQKNLNIKKEEWTFKKRDKVK